MIDNKSYIQRKNCANFFTPIPTTHTTQLISEDSFLLKSWENVSLERMREIVEETIDPKMKEIRMRVLQLKEFCYG